MMSGTSCFRDAVAVLFWSLLVAQPDAPWAGRDLLAAPLPDLSRVDAGVQAQVRGVATKR